ncbi:uncharacterized protein LOC114748635 isoform X1 [Neltuma alba]|uniref:uncharacterized protein LOC114748635 isoform X1 n=1 Tax=Neltuma alba TaxID=207710 RepID=UPI0010A32A91|nr:uncharacterized protein LOC114748635 isoform X1 [Prosopis alba]
MTLSVSEFRSWQLWAPIPLVALVCRLPLSAIGLLFYPDQRKNDMILSRQGQPRKARMRLYQAVTECRRRLVLVVSLSAVLLASMEKAQRKNVNFCSLSVKNNTEKEGRCEFVKAGLYT